MLQQIFIELAGNYSSNIALVDELWAEIEKSYSEKTRHYHTLAHLENLLSELQLVQPQIGSWETVLFSLFYHDIVYNASKSNNEERSAEAAAKVMRSLSIADHVVAKCTAQILATQKHQLSADADTNLFIDADLSILGKTWDDYLMYSRQVRKEYSIYPDLLYNPGRRKVLHNFLEMESIYKTEHFIDKYEK